MIRVFFSERVDDAVSVLNPGDRRHEAVLGDLEVLQYVLSRHISQNSGPAQTFVPRQMHVVWMGGELSPDALEHLRAWRRAAGGEVPLHLWTVPAVNRWSGEHRSLLGDLVEIHDDTMDLVQAVGGRELTILVDDALAAGAFPAASDLIRLSACG